MHSPRTQLAFLKIHCDHYHFECCESSNHMSAQSRAINGSASIEGPHVITTAVEDPKLTETDSGFIRALCESTISILARLMSDPGRS